MLTLQQATNELEFRAKKFVKTIKRLLCKWVSVYSHVVNILVATEKKKLTKNPNLLTYFHECLQEFTIF